MNVINPGPSFGGNIGTALGQGLSYMAQSKMAQMQQRQGQEQTFKLLTMLGAPENHAAALALAPKEVLEKILPTYIPALARQQDMSQQQQQPENGMAQLQGMSQAAPSQEAALGAPKADLMQGQDRQELQEDLSKKVNEPRVSQSAVPQVQPQVQTQPVPVARQTKTSVLGATGGPAVKDQLAAAKMTQKYRDELADKADYAHEAISALDTILDIDKRGDTINPILYGTLTKAGFPLEGFLSDDSVLLNKTKGIFFKGLKPLFGSRVTEKEVKYFLDTIPTLMISASGREVVARNMKNALQRDILKQEAEDQIIKEYGYPPLNIRNMIEDRVRPQINALDEQFKQEMKQLRAAKTQAGAKFDKLPNAKDFPVNAQIKDPSGKILTNNGTTWV